MLVTLAHAAQTVQISQSVTNVLRHRFVLDCVIAVLLNGVNSPREEKLARRMIRTPIMGPVNKALPRVRFHDLRHTRAAADRVQR